MSEELGLEMEVIVDILGEATEVHAERIKEVKREPGSVKVLVEFDIAELNVLKALLGTPNPVFETNEMTMEIAAAIFNDIKEIY